MKKLSLILLSAVLMVTMVITSCKKEAFSPGDAYDLQKKYDNFTDSLSKRNNFIRDSLAKVGGIVNYTVAVIDGSAAATGKKAGIDLSGAVVVISQFGTVATATTDATGKALFTDLRSGTVSISISLTGYAPVNVVADLGSSTNGASIIRQVATSVPLLATTGSSLATIKGVIQMEKDLTNDLPEAADGVDVTVSVNPANLINLTNTDNDLAGAIIRYTYGNMLGKTTTDVNGNFSLSVPSTVGGLAYALQVMPVLKDQTLLLNTKNGIPVFGPQTITNVAFGPGGAASTIPQVAPGYITFPVPTGTATEGTGAAIGNVTMGLGSIEQLVPGISTGGGAIYSQAPKVTFSVPGSTTAVATANLGSDNRISNITLSNAGAGYPMSTLATSTVGAGLQDHDATAANIATASMDGKFSYGFGSATMGATTLGTFGGAGYTSTPTINVNDAGTNGSGLAITAIMVPDGPGSTTLKIGALNITNKGSGYTSFPTVTISGGNPSSPAGAISLSQTNFVITTIRALTPGSDYTAAPFVIIRYPTGTNVYTAPVLVATPDANKMLTQASYVITNGGMADQAPSEIIISTKSPLGLKDAGGTVICNTSSYFANSTNWATLKSQVNNNGAGGVLYDLLLSAIVPVPVLAVDVTNGGSGYVTAPTIISNTATASNTITPGTFTAVVDANGRVTGVTVATGGKYLAVPTLTTLDASAGNKPRKAIGIPTFSNDGRVTGCNFGITAIGLDAGAGYTADFIVDVLPSVTGFGTGGKLKFLVNASGAITGTLVINGGSGYLGGNKLATGRAVDFGGLNNVNPAGITGGANPNVTATAGATSTYFIYLGSGLRPNVAK